MRGISVGLKHSVIRLSISCGLSGFLFIVFLSAHGLRERLDNGGTSHGFS